MVNNAVGKPAYKRDDDNDDTGGGGGIENSCFILAVYPIEPLL